MAFITTGCRPTVPESEPRVRIHPAPPSSPVCRGFHLEMRRVARTRWVCDLERNRRTALIGRDCRSLRVFSIGQEGGGLHLPNYALACSDFGARTNQERKHFEEAAGVEYVSPLSVNGSQFDPSPRSSRCARQLRGRSPRRVERAWAVSSGGWWPHAISSTIEGARKANLTMRLT